MREMTKLIRRFLGILVLSTVLILLLNVCLLVCISLRQTASVGPWTTAEETLQALQEGEGGYVLPEKQAAELENEHAWAILIDNQTLEVTWYTQGLPETVPLSYTASQIAGLTRGYIDGYPTYTGEAEKGLLVLGYPKDRYWKHITPSWDYNFIKNLPFTMLAVFGMNVLLIFFIYLIANTKLLRSVRPLAEGIETLSLGQPVEVSEKGVLSGLAVRVNETSRILQSQQRELRKKETARANWISGVSHDIRTPLSMVMGYAEQLEEKEALSAEDRKKAEIIRQQSLKMKNLINDLNLASKLEYQMQPLHLEPVSLSSVVRQSAADFINADPEERYVVELEIPDTMDSCQICGDKELLLRALYNLLSNSRSHNPRGCRIRMEVQALEEGFLLAVEDDGAGITEEKLERLRTAPHYMMSDTGTEEPRHGLGLLIVQQIAAVHGGTAAFAHGKNGGFRVEIFFSNQKRTGI